MTNSNTNRLDRMRKWITRTPKGLMARPMRPDINQAKVMTVGSISRWTQAEMKTRVKGNPKAVYKMQNSLPYCVMGAMWPYPASLKTFMIHTILIDWVLFLPTVVTTVTVNSKLWPTLQLFCSKSESNRPMPCWCNSEILCSNCSNSVPVILKLADYGWAPLAFWWAMSWAPATFENERQDERRSKFSVSDKWAGLI